MEQKEYRVWCRVDDYAFLDCVYAESSQDAVDLIRRETRYVDVLRVALVVDDWK